MAESKLEFTFLLQGQNQDSLMTAQGICNLFGENDLK